MGDLAAYHLFAHDTNPFTKAQLETLRAIPNLHVHDEPHLGLEGVDAIRQQLKLMLQAMRTSNTPYITKLDSDCLLFGKRFLQFLAAGKHPMVATWSPWGCLGAFAHYRRDAVEYIAALGEEGITQKAKTAQLSSLLGEDEVLSHLLAMHYVPNWNKTMHKRPSSLAPLFIEGPNGKSGFFNFYQPTHENPASQLHNFDVIEFGRKYRFAETLKPKSTPGIMMIPKGTTPEKLAEMQNAAKAEQQKQLSINPLHDPRVIEAIYQAMKSASQEKPPL